MVKKFILCLMVFVLMASFVSAYETEVVIKTAPNENVGVNVLNGGEGGGLVMRYKNYSDQYGDVKFTIDSPVPTYNIIVSVVDAFEEVLVYEQFMMAYKAEKDIKLIRKLLTGTQDHQTHDRLLAACSTIVLCLVSSFFSCAKIPSIAVPCWGDR